MANTIILGGIVGFLIGMFGPDSIWTRMALGAIAGFFIGYFNVGG